ncbi:MAG: DNA mismatch repair endonuclease MutL [Halobacteriales archaeon]|nr:DNA mismatch repair endonuclease MutL [Halobacteriales archaeon]
MAITELDDDTVRRIAAGEVVERPASAVKELVENSLDAGASRVRVEVAAGGKDRIAVIDDGEGMPRAEARLAVKEHTTSKIRSADDLTAGIGTLGFRGEALYAIGAVSTMTLTTRPADAEEATRVRVERGEVVDVEPAGRAPGTTVEVTDLFSGMPAREKFLAEDATEFDHVNRIVSRYALANPGVAISLHHDGREVFATDGQGTLEGALLAVYGREVAESMRPVDGDGVTGAVSHPETTRSTREYVSTFVNGRYVASGELRGAVVEAYGRQLAPDRYPFAAVFVEVDPDAVDVNVHPRKLEVRFDDAAAVRERVRAAVEDALLEGGLLRAGAPRGKSAPAEVEPRPEPAGGEQSVEAEASSAVTEAPPESTEESAPVRPATAEPPEFRNEPADADTADREPPAWHPTRRVRDRGTQTTLAAGRADEAGGYERLPALRVLGQLDDTYVVCEADGGLVLVDQHAADERVHYERLADALAGDPGVQSLAEPVELELTAREVELFDAFLEALERVGFRAERAGERTVRVTAVPAVLEGALDAGLLRDVLPELVSEGEARSVDAAADAVIADLACHPAVTGQTSLAAGSIRGLLEALDACENPYACPHGRPTMVEVSADELADRFERDYPGHAERREEP